MQFLDWSDWRYLFKHRIGGWFQRANRGWADHDTWSFDTYLAEVMAGGLKRLADNSHGHPCDFPGGAEGWRQWLLDKAQWLEWYADDMESLSSDEDWITPGLTGEEKHRRIMSYSAKMKQFHEEVMPDLGRHFGALWD